MTEFVKHDGGKARMDLLPPRAVEEVAAVLAFGAKKYADNNWRLAPDTKRYVAAALRHVFAFMRGEQRDPETKRHHLAHAACCALFIVDLDLEKETTK